MVTVPSLNSSWAGIDRATLPRHIAAIMDGNRRWALARQLPGKNGHRAGRDTLRELVKSCLELGIPYLTVFAFSTENWKRSADEIGFLWVLLRETLEREAKKLCENDVRLRFIGEIGELAPDLQVRIRRAEGLTATSRSLTLNIALNYGGRREIVAAARQLAQAVLAGELAPTQIDESVFSTYLYTKDQPDPDLLIRTSGEFRISNYLLWQLAYAEIYVTKALWPDFNRQDLCEALLEYQRRDRRFGARP